MTVESEKVIEDNLIKQLTTLGYSYVTIKDEKDLLNNLKRQLEKHNNIAPLSENEFKQVLNHLNKGNVFDKANILRDQFNIKRDNGESTYIEFIQKEHWCQNQFQVTNQITIDGTYKNRYDVTILINGLPLVQIELKKRGIELKQAFNQINRYQRHSFGASQGLFQYVQIFVISNGVNTKYYSNNKEQSFKETFYWTDIDNKLITRLESFAQIFLEPCHISKMITKYIVMYQTTDKKMLVLRPYQYYGVESIVERVKNTDKNGYIWHTTGSGKTLTSFKTSQILMDLPKVHKVVFVVDRKDLDYQTAQEFNFFSPDSVDSTTNTNNLVKQLLGTYINKKGEIRDTKLIVTTIQKLNSAIMKNNFSGQIKDLADKKIVFIFDECHRSQFGDTHKRIKEFFTNAQMFGFTGTPIFVDNSVRNEHGKRTTKELFEECLHKYVITDAIKDENVLKFSIEYIGKYKEKESRNNIDIEVEAIDTKELMESPLRLEKITDYILANHNRKTHNKEFTAMFCVNSVDTLIKYYELFKGKKEQGLHNLKIATIFSYTANEDDKDANGFIPDAFDDNNSKVNVHTREKLDQFISDYNKMFGCSFSTKDTDSFYNYYKDIAKKVKERKIDILLVVNMFLTGFDSKHLNTLYVDKNLKYHGLLQAYSRTNRILNEKKSQGNIIAFRNLKQATDDSIALFSNKEAKEIIIIEPFENYVEKFKNALEKLRKIAPTADSVNELPSEVEELEFVKTFRELIRVKNVLETFSDFEFESLDITEDDFIDYKTKYVDLHDKVKTSTEKEKVSILEDVDFELELIHRDDINVTYILKLLANLKGTDKTTTEKQKKEIVDLLGSEIQLRSKKELIEKFIDKNLPIINNSDDIPEEFNKYWNEEQKIALNNLAIEEQLIPDGLKKVLDNYLFTQRQPLRDDVVNILITKPKILERKTITERVISKIVDFVDTFINGIDG